MKLGTEALFIDLLAETPGAPPYTQRPLAEPEREDAVLAECLNAKRRADRDADTADLEDAL